MLDDNGERILIGDTLEIDGHYRGRVIACMDSDTYLPGAESWTYLRVGIIVDTDFGGRVHYTEEARDGLVVIRRAGADTP